MWKHRFNAPITLPGITIAKKLCFLVIFKIFQDLYLCLYLDIYQLKCFLFHQIYEIWKTKIKKMSITGCPSRKFKKHIKLIWEKVNKNSNIWKKQNEEESCVWCFDKKNKVEWDVLLPLSSLWNTLFLKKNTKSEKLRRKLRFFQANERNIGGYRYRPSWIKNS